MRPKAKQICKIPARSWALKHLPFLFLVSFTSLPWTPSGHSERPLVSWQHHPCHAGSPPPPPQGPLLALVIMAVDDSFLPLSDSSPHPWSLHVYLFLFLKWEHYQKVSVSSLLVIAGLSTRFFSPPAQPTSSLTPTTTDIQTSTPVDGKRNVWRSLGAWLLFGGTGSHSAQSVHPPSSPHTLLPVNHPGTPSAGPTILSTGCLFAGTAFQVSKLETSAANPNTKMGKGGKPLGRSFNA